MSNIPPFEKLDKRVQRSLDLLYQSFVELLKEKHYTYIKIQEITKAAKINRATFYNHFENMTDFIIFCTREGFRREVIHRFQNDEYHFNEKNIYVLIQGVLTFMSTEYTKWHYQWDENIFEKALRIELYNFLSDHIDPDNEQLNQPVFGNTTALLISASIVGLGMVWCSNGCIEQNHILALRITNFIFSGFQEPKKK